MLATTSTATSTRWSFTLLNTRIELRSMFIATLFLFLFLCLAYLSNPSETSFRSYLTEQSFRHHLSRLDDPADSDHTDSEDSATNHRSSSTQSSSSFGSLESGSSAFHFSNRAAVALRTSRHAFHSFGVFTIAAIIPNHKTHLLSRDSPSVVSSASDGTGSSDPHISSFKETWFVGAFGRWWQGGVVDPSWQSGPSLHSKCDEEGWSSGILNIKALDRYTLFFSTCVCSPGLPFPSTTHSSRTPQRSPPPKLRSRDRSASRLGRSSTPPPLPKSAVLPLHIPKHNQSLPTSPSPPSRQRPLPPHYPPSPPSAHGATPNGASPNFDSAPAVVELDRQISQTLALNRELHNQLSEHASTTTTVDAALGDELNSARDMKRADDAARSELKVRTKTLEDSRRAAEAGKRDAERRLRATQKAKAEASTRIERLGEEIRALDAQVQRDEVAVLTAGEAAAQEAQDIRSQVKRRKREVRVAEGVVTALNIRVRELEESIERERIASVAAREKAEALRREQQNYKYGFILKKPQDTWELMHVTDPSLANPAPESGMGHALLEPFPTPLEKDSDRDRERGCSRTVSTRSSPHLHTLSTSPSIGYNAPSQTQFQPVGEPLARLAKGYTIFDEDLASLSNPSHSSKFLPFGDSDVANVKRTLPLIQDGPIQSLDGMPAVATVGDVGMPEDMLSPSFQSVNDTFLDHDWCGRVSIPEFVPVSGSDARRHVFPGAHDDPIDAFEPLGLRPPPRHRITSDPMDVQRVWLSPGNSETVTSPIATASPHEMRIRWWRSADKERRSTIDGSEPRKGLNPDAKVFNFSGRPLFRGPAAPAFDSLNASTSNFPISGGASSSSGTSSGSDNANGSATATTVATGNGTPGFLSGLAMRAFAPSRAEREALQRALGGSTNTSLERLPSLSEVPTSPVRTHAPAHVAAPGAPSNPPGLPWFDMGPGVSAGHSWSREFGGSVPRPRKIKFSPWGDGEDGIEADK